MTQLPEKFSDGIRLAVADMKKCEENPAYKIDMGRWHRPLDGKCHVCMAGAVMAQTFAVKCYEMAYAGQPEFKDNGSKLAAFDTLRGGSCYFAFEEYTGRTPKDENGILVLKGLPDYRSYEDDKERFYEWCLAVADAFERIGE